MIDTYVYMWTNKETGASYVGKGVRGRAESHARISKHANAAHPLHRAMREHGLESFELKYLAFGMDDSTARSVETAAISAYGTSSPAGYNQQLGRPLTDVSPLTKKVCSYLSESDMVELRRLSKEEGVSIASLVRRSVMEAAERAGF